MKKLIASLAIAGMVFFGTSNVYAQEDPVEAAPAE